MRKGKLTELWVGVLVIVALLVFMMAIFMIGREQQLLELRYDLRAIFGSVAGLRTGAPVRLAGVNVGMVKQIRFASGQKNVEVILSIRRSVQPRICVDSRAHILSLGLLGDKYVEITLGSPEATPLKNGGQIATKNPVEFIRVIEEFSPVLIETRKVLERFNPILTNTESISSSLAGIFKEVEHGKGTLGGMVKDKKAYEELVAMVKSAGDFFDSLNEVFSAFRRTPFYRDFIKVAPSKDEGGPKLPSLYRIPPSLQPLTPENLLP